jgi:hypothetical protein
MPRSAHSRGEPLQPHGEAGSRSAGQQIPSLLRNCEFNYKVKMNKPLTLSWASWTQSTLSQPISLKTILIVTSPPTQYLLFRENNLLLQKNLQVFVKKQETLLGERVIAA